MSRYLGVGWEYPIETRAGGRDGARAIATATEEQRVRQAIEIILSTARGERVMRPVFGCSLQELVFEPNNATTRGLAQSYVREALRKWEPRIDVLDVEVRSEELHPERLDIRIDYRLRADDSRFNLVYPFYLDRGAR